MISPSNKLHGKSLYNLCQPGAIHRNFTVFLTMARAKFFCTEVRSWSGTELTSKVLHFDSKGILCKTIGTENAVCGCEIYYLRTVKSWLQMLLCLGRNNFNDKGSSSWWGEIRSASKQVLRHNITWRIYSGPEQCVYFAFVTCNILYSYICQYVGRMVFFYVRN